MDRRREVGSGAAAGGLPERVGAEVAARGLRVDAPLGVDPEQLRCRCVEFTSSVECHGSEIQIDAVQRRRQSGHRNASGSAHGQPQRGDTVLQIGEHRLVEAGGIRQGVPLSYVPAARRVALGPAAAGEGAKPGYPASGALSREV